jgi:hypothetical protein
VEALVLQILQFGQAPAIIALAFFMGVVLKKISENGKADSARGKDFQKAIERRDEEIKVLAERQAVFEGEYLTKEAFFSFVSGWRTDLYNNQESLRTELRGMRGDMTTINTNLLKAVLEGHKDGK